MQKTNRRNPVGIETPHGTISAEYFRARNDVNGNPQRGWSIFIDSRDIGFVPERFQGTQALRDALDFLGVPNAQAMDYSPGATVVDAEHEFTGTQYASLVNTWEWDDRLMRGELEQYRGMARG